MADYTKADALGPAKCFATWDEARSDNTIRTEMDNGSIRSRRRFTGVQRSLQVSVVVDAKEFAQWDQWYRAAEDGARPVKLKTPWGAEEVWAFAGPPQIGWPESNAFSYKASFYQRDEWKDRN